MEDYLSQFMPSGKDKIIRRCIPTGWAGYDKTVRARSRRWGSSVRGVMLLAWLPHEHAESHSSVCTPGRTSAARAYVLVKDCKLNSAAGAAGVAGAPSSHGRGHDGAGGSFAR